MTKPILDENCDINDIYIGYYFYERHILTEAFIEKYQDEVYWREISRTQILSNKFMAKHVDKLDFCFLKINKNVDQTFVERLQLLK